MMSEINIVGAGLAGLSAAITLAKHNIKCNLVSVQPSERAQSVLAEGGINAALNTMDEDDSVQNHFEDTMKGGVYLADPKAVENLVSHAPEIVNGLADIGVPFRFENGKMILRNFGGQKKKRTAYAKSSTGKALMSALIDEARKYEVKGLIKRYPNHRLVELIVNGDGVKTCSGFKAIDLNTDKVMIFSGKVILAAGGMNGVFPGVTTGTVNNKGNVTADFFAKGGELADLEFIQYHPTTVGIAGKRMLISEAARGEGGRLFVMKDGEPWYFMEELYPELGNLMPRDVVSREIYKVKNDPLCGDEVYLDLTGIDEKTFDEKLSDMRDEIKDYLNKDIKNEPVEVNPGIHFFMGGIRTDAEHRTSIENIYAAGECAYIYHGANRLGGNSLLGAIFGGRVAAETVMSDIVDNKVTENEEPLGIENKRLSEYSDADEINGISEHIKVSEKKENINKTDINDIRNESEHNLKAEVRAEFSEKLSDILLSGLGIIRNEHDMKAAMQGLLEWRKAGQFNGEEYKMLNLAEAMLMSAILRKESRGAHFRIDFPDRDDENFKKITVARFIDDKTDIKFEEIG